VGEALSLGNLAKISHYLGQVEESFTWAREALEAYRRMGHREGVRNILHLWGKWVTELGDGEQKKRFEEAAARVMEETGDPLMPVVRARMEGSAE
jgi:hypothetical protein